MISSFRPPLVALSLALATLCLVPSAAAQHITVGRLPPGTLRIDRGSEIDVPTSIGVGMPDDGDGLTALEESAGWDIAIDELGYGPTAPIQLLTIRHVTSDPNNPDTDGDTLTDDLEWLIGTDPRSDDTDGDGLTDSEEWRGWLSNPNTVDTDGDSRGPAGDLTPNANLFDGYELAALRGLVPPGTKPDTSPTLADTDGDGRTDFEELFADGVSPIFAELPTADIFIAGNLDVRLDVTYEESVAGEVGYEVSLESSSTSTLGLEESNSTATTSATHTEASLSTSFEASASVTQGATSTPPSYSTEVSLGFSVGGGTSFTQGLSTELSKESVFTSSQESSQTSSQVRSQYVSDTNTFTETAATGSVTLPIRIFNDGDFSYTVTNLGITLLSFDPGGIGTEDGPYRAMGTITPQLPSATLAPGELTPVMTLDSGDLNADVVKDFLAAPNTLVLQPASFDLLDQNGIDFDFIRENALSQTALVEIDYGDGQFESYRVATNVARDNEGQLIGIALRQVLELDLGLDVVTEELQAIGGGPIDGSMGVPITVLTELEGRAAELNGDTASAFWIVMRNGDYDEGNVATLVTGTPPNEVTETFVHFDLIRLFAGDRIQLIYTRDPDGDGLWGVEESVFGSDGALTDTDLDGLLDRAEALEGWDVTIESVTRRVYSDPRLVDTDGDGLDDADEFNGGVDSTDPRDPDTDKDGLEDGVDPFPSVPANRFYRILPGGGAPEPPWTNESMASTFATVESLNSDGDSTNDISEIWVTSGIWNANQAPQTFPQGGVKVYGGFTVGDTKLGQRDPDPMTNGCAIAGAPISWSFGPSNGSVLDGFAIVDDSSLVVDLGQSYQVALRNLVFLNNDLNPSLTSGFAALTVQDCDFIQNAGPSATVVDGSFNSNFIDCSFLFNTNYGDTSFIRGGAYEATNALWTQPSFTRCLFQANQLLKLAAPVGSPEGGGACFFGASGARITHCDFVDNVASSTSLSVPDLNGGALYWSIIPGPLGIKAPLSLVNCRFYGNNAWSGSVVAIDNESPTPSAERVLSAVNCTFSGNKTWNNAQTAVGIFSDTSDFDSSLDLPIILRNCVSHGNLNDDDFFPTAAFNLGGLDPNNVFVPNTTDLDMVGCLIEGAPGVPFALWTFQNIWDTDPLFVAPEAGNFRLQSGSPAIDAGLSFVDIDPLNPGVQPLPATDLDGNPRTVDGDGFGGAQIDIGAYELQ